MKERPILLNAEMVRAVLAGRKTQTRRMLTPRQLNMIDAAASIGECYPLEYGHQHENSQSYYREWCPFGAVGNRLWVRETWARYNIDQDSHDIAYCATTPDDWPKEGRWRPSIHMPRWASRITLEITGVRVERLQDISAEDVTAEGIKTLGESMWGPQWWLDAPQAAINDAQLQFSIIWSKIYGEESWQANPWVWVIKFKRVEG